MKNKVYDFIVFGTTIPGIVFAIRKSLEGHSVLLTNIFGFPGGSITEHLNCLQEVNEGQLNGIAKNIFQSISRDNFEHSIVNPESLKFILQQTIEQTNVELYFHAVPKNIDVRENNILEVSFLAKEGITKFKGTKIVDASEDFYGAVLFNRKRAIIEQCINIFISPPANDKFLTFGSVRKAVKLSDGRYWLSLAIESHDDLFVENETHTVLNTFRVVLEKSYCRIQVLPLGVQTMYKMNAISSLNDSVVTIDDILGSSFKSSEQFLKASIIETIHKKFH
jgi:hypothetical protein